MASWNDLEARATKLGATAVYIGDPPKWLQNVTKACVAAPVVVNVKGCKPDQTPVVITLAELEALRLAAAGVKATD